MVTRWEGEDDAWYEQPGEVQWVQAMEGLRSGRWRKQLELKPDDWVRYRFGDGIDGFQIRDAWDADPAYQDL